MPYNYTSFQKKTIRERAKHLGLFVFIQFLIPLLSGYIVASASSLLVFFYERPQFEKTMEEGISGSFPLIMLVSYGFSALLFLIYNMPIWMDAWKGDFFSDKSKTRVLASSLSYGLLGIIREMTPFFLVGILLWFRDMPIAPRIMLFVFASSFVRGVLCMSVTYFAVEILNRRFVMQIIFTDGRVSPYSTGLRASLFMRLFVLFVAVSVFPTMVFAIGLYNSGQRILQGGLEPIVSAPAIVITLLIFMISGIFITWLVGGTLAPPLELLLKATERIRNGDFQVELPIPSGDSLGQLTESVNSMASSLREKEFIMDIFGRVVDPTIRDHLLKGDVHIGGETRRVTILFSDIRDFTGFSENNTPARIVFLLNRYFEKMSEAISAGGGLVNKFVGDAIMAIFNAPTDCESHETAALNTARCMIRERELLNEEIALEGFKPIRTGIGIHTGEVLAGNIGSKNRMEYTVIGDAVNVASRLESLTKKLGHEIILSGETYKNLVDRHMLERIANVKVKGRSAAIEVFGLKK